MLIQMVLISFNSFELNHLNQHFYETYSDDLYSLTGYVKIAESNKNLLPLICLDGICDILHRTNRHLLFDLLMILPFSIISCISFVNFKLSNVFTFQ